VVDGTNTLACTQATDNIRGDVKVYPLPHLAVIKDLVPDLTHAYAQYALIEPWLKTVTPTPERERLQSREDRAKLEAGAGPPGLHHEGRRRAAASRHPCARGQDRAGLGGKVLSAAYEVHFLEFSYGCLGRGSTWS
jgi:hypothetical protein